MTLANDYDAYIVLEWLRWNGEPQCGHCGSFNVGYLRPQNGLSRLTHSRRTYSPRRVWRCHTCRLQFSVFTGTALQGTKIAARHWIAGVEQLALEPTISIRRLAARIGINPSGVQSMLRTLRTADDPFVAVLIWHGLERTGHEPERT